MTDHSHRRRRNRRSALLLHRLTGDEKHDASAHSTLDVLWVLYDRVLRVTPETGRTTPDRDRFLLSKGHGPAAYYAVLAAKGFIPDAWLDDWRPGQPARPPPGPGARPRRGDLLRLARARAAARRRHRARPAGPGPDRRPRVYVLLGDAELDEGSNHEAIAYAGATGLDSLTAIVIDNALRHHGWPGGIASRFAVNGWTAATVDGRDHDAIETRADAPTTPTVRTWSSPRVESKGMTAMRDAFIDTTTALLDEDPRTALVLADISAAASRRPPAATPTG